MSHIYHELYFHVIWTTKYREELITDFVKDKLKLFITEKINKLNGRLLEFNTVSEHCHLLVKTLPQMSVSDFVGQIKGYSSHEMNQIMGEKYLQWQQGFGVLSLSKKSIPFIRRYIQNQKQHHQDNTIIDILEYTSDD